MKTPRPEKAGESANTPLPATHRSTPRPVRVLLVDDSRLFLDAASDVLARYTGVQIVGRATSGLQALECVSKLSPDVVFTDLIMPGMDGQALTRQIKAQAGAPKVVIVTLHDGLDSRAGALAAGADGFLPKHRFVGSVLPLLCELFAEEEL